MRTQRATLALSLLAVLLLAATTASAQIRPSSEVLVPYFAVDLAQPLAGDGTLFAVCNHGPEASDVLFTVHSNWGIPLLEVRATMQGDEVISVDAKSPIAAPRSSRCNPNIDIRFIVASVGPGTTSR